MQCKGDCIGHNSTNRSNNNYHQPDIYPSNLVDWQPISSVVGTFDVFHGFIGERMYKGRTSNSLIEKGVFFYDSFYTATANPRDSGTLESYNVLSLIVKNGQYLTLKQGSVLH